MSQAARLLNTSWRLFRAFRVDVRVSWSVIVWPLFLAWGFAKWMPGLEALAWGCGWTVAIFATTWTHEMGHIFMGRRCGIETDTMTLRALGGLAHLQAPAQTPHDEMKIALAGPATHLVWMAVLYPAVWLLRGAHGGDVWYWMLDGFASIQLSMMIFNLLPIWPLDGGRTLRGALSTRINANLASLRTSTIGFVGNGLFILFGLLAMLKFADPFGYGPYGFLLAMIGLEGIQACVRLRMEARHSDIYGENDPFARTLLASQQAVREMEEEERKTRHAVRDRRAEAQATVDRLLDRINEVGGMDRLTSAERKELDRASRELRETP